MKKVKNHLLPIVKAAVSLWTPIGGAISSLLGDYAPHFLQKCGKKNSANCFPGLVLSVLERFAVRWVDMFSNIPINYVTLYHKRPQYDFKIMSIYGVVFEIDPEIKLLIKTVPEIEEEYNKLQENTGSLWMADNIVEFDVLGIDASFSEVYKQKPSSNDFMKEWFFITKVIGDTDDQALMVNMKVMTNEPYWTLFRKR